MDFSKRIVLLAALVSGYACAGKTTTGSDGGDSGGGGANPTQPRRYVATNGDDALAGTEQLPWRTIQRAFDAAQPGETVYIKGGVYRERLTLRVSGNPTDGVITFQNFGTDTVIVDGTGTETLGLYLVTITDRSHVTIAGLHLANNILDKGGGILITGTGQRIQFLNNKISHIRTPGLQADARSQPLLIAGTDLRNVVIAGNEIFDVTTGASEALALTCNVTDFVVADNFLHDIDDSGIDASGGYAGCPDRIAFVPRNGAIRGNLLDRVGVPPFGGGAITVDGGRDIVVERNIVRNSTNAILVTAEQPFPYGDTSGIVIRDNVAYGNTNALLLGEWPSYLGSTHDVQVLNNTFFDNDVGVTLNRATNVMLRNNIFAENGVQVVNQPGGSPVDVSLDYNLYSGSGLFYWGSAENLDFDGHVAVSRQDGNSLFSAPGFVRTTPDVDLRLTPTSSARDRGDPAFVPGRGELDLAGNPRVARNRVDMGAYELQ